MTDSPESTLLPATSERHGNDLAVTQDRIFDGLAEKFASSLYGSPRGAIRLAVLDKVMTEDIPADNAGALDVGGGLGQMSAWLARRGHPVTLAEPSTDMLAAAKDALKALPMTYVQAPLQSLDQHAPGPWQLIVCHAVLEWMAQPRQGLAHLASLLARDGRLSLMVFNRDALRFSNVVKGNLNKASEDRLSGTGKRQRLTPISPLTHADIQTWCREENLIIESVAGIRIFHDYLRERSIDDAMLASVIELECQFCRTDPHWRLGRYLHYTLRHRDNRELS